MRRHKSLFVITILFLFSISNAGAKDINVHGFLSQGVIYTTDNNYYGKSSDVSYEHREYGVNVHYEIRDCSYLSFQLISKEAGDMYSSELEFDYIYINQILHDSSSTQTRGHFGKIKPPIGLYNETREAPTARSGIWMPQGIYVEGLGLREHYTGIDGMSISHDRFERDTLIKADIAISIPQDLDDKAQAAFLGSIFEGDLRMDLGAVARVQIDPMASNTLYSITYIGSRTTYEQADTNDPLDDGDVTVNTLTLSTETNLNRFRWINEGVARYIDTDGFGDSFNDGTRIEAGFYTELRFIPSLTYELFTRYEMLYRDISDRDGSEFSQRADLAKHRAYQHQIGVGALWNLTDNWQLRAEAHRVRGTALTPISDNPEFTEGGGERDWNKFGLQMTFSF